jgi:hypothetical protein
VHIHIFKYEVLARIGGVASDDPSWQNVVVGGDVPQSNVSHGDVRVGWALFNKRIEEGASWVTSSIWLMLLLWADVDRPPDWLVDNDIFVCDSLNKTITNIAWVWLDVNTFQWLFHNDISECNILNTSVPLTWWHRTYS